MIFLWKSILCLSHARCRQTVLSQAVAQRCHPSQVMRSRSYYSFFFLDLLVFIEITRKSAIFMIPLWSLQICFLPARHNLRWFQDHSTRAKKWCPDHPGTFRCHRQKCRKIFAHGNSDELMMVTDCSRMDCGWASFSGLPSSVQRSLKNSKTLHDRPGFHPSFDDHVCSDFVAL